MGRIWCWKELNHCIMVSDRGIWGLSAESLLLRSYQLLCSSPIASTHNEASRQASLFTTIWLTFRHAQKRGICQIHLCLCQLLSTCGNICSTSSSFGCVPTISHRHVFCARLLISTWRKCWHEQRLTSACGRWNVGLQWRNVDTYQRTGDTEASCVPLLTATRPPNH